VQSCGDIVGLFEILLVSGSPFLLGLAILLVFILPLVYIGAPFWLYLFFMIPLGWGIIDIFIPQFAFLVWILVGFTIYFGLLFLWNR